MSRLASSRGSVGRVGVWIACVGTVLGVSAALANPRIECEGTPRLEEAGPDGVEISTEKLGLVRVTEAGDADKDDVLTPDAFCEAHEGIDVFILPAPRLIDAPPEPEHPEGLSPERPMDDSAGDDKGFGDDSDDEDDDDDDSGDEAVPSVALTGAPGDHKRLSLETAEVGGCSQAPTDADRTAWLLALPIALFGLRRRRGGR